MGSLLAFAYSEAHRPSTPTPVPTHEPPSRLRDPQAMLAAVLAGLHPQEDLWLFAYGSLIWNPEVDAVEQRRARVPGWHRALRMHSRINRGTPQRPGLVFALIAGGCCRGLAYRVPRARAELALRRLWPREMPNGVYDPRWLVCHTVPGVVRALAFTLSKRSPNFTGRLDDAHLLDVLRHSSGRYGRTLDYLAQTAQGLREHGIQDREVERLMALAQAHGLA